MKSTVEAAEKIRQIAESFADDCDQQRKEQKIPDVTCPLIDRAQRSLDSAARTLSRIDPDNPDHSDIANAQHEIETVSLEEIREANRSLREIGQTWYDIAKQYRAKLDELVAELND